MGLFSKINNINPAKVVDESLPTPAGVDEKSKEEISPAVSDETVEVNPEVTEKPSEVEKIYKIKFAGKKYKVTATSPEEAKEKVKTQLGITDNNSETPIITVKDIMNAIAYEINRIVTVAHPETVKNTYDRWICVLTEELGEIVHEINDAYEGKPAKKNTFVECVQLSAATILLAKKFANDHPELFKEKENETL